MPQIHPSLWFDTEGLEAAEFYCSVFPNSKVGAVSYYGDAGPGPAGTPLVVEFSLDGHPVMAINGGPVFHFTEAVSLVVTCADQAEIDYYWDKLSGGGETGQCGWLKDRYGLSWQVVPSGIADYLGDPNDEGGQRAMQAMLGMTKIDIAALQSARAGS